MIAAVPPTSDRTHRMTTIATGRARLAATALALTAAAWPAEGAAQAWRDQITRQISSSSIVADLRDRGYAQTHGPIIELVDARERREVPVELEGGRTYSFVGKCDNDCSDLDLRLYDAGGALLASDIELDDHPVISATPSRSGRYTLVVTMADCSTSSCGLGVVGFGEARRAIAPVARPASTGSGWRGEVRRQLESSSIVASLKADGWRESHDTFYDLVATGSSDTVSVELQGGRAYRFVGKCDNDCSDLDFRLYDASGALVDSDLQTDDVPVIAVPSARSGTYRLRVTMAACSVALCGWGVTVLAR